MPGTRTWVLTAAMLAACATNDAGDEDAGHGEQPPPRTDFGNTDSGMTMTRTDAGTDAAKPTGPMVKPCEVIDVRNVDLLFMVDNSSSMSDEQESLRREFPKLIRTLTSGDRDGDGTEDFPPVENLHLGVVSSDMGLPEVDGIPNCEGLGDDGILRSTPQGMPDGCDTSYPQFLEYVAGEDQADAIADDFSCIASLGTQGCGFEQQLESALKAMWPEADIDPNTGMARDPNRIDFIGDLKGFGTTGHGDALNAGFLRPKVGEEISVVAIVMVTDEEDCSSTDTVHFTPGSQLEDGDPLKEQGLNVRCFFNPANLFPVERYVDGYQQVREGNEELVVFAAIVGVPPDLVDADALADVDFSDEVSREKFYDDILADDRMQEVLDEDAPQPNLTPSCDVPGVGVAYPPRRIVEVARGFGERGRVQSICQDDFGPAVDVLVESIGQTIGEACIVN